jgi:AcrR family transcriptional regulator
MGRTENSTRERILTTAYELLYKEGFARVSMDAIAQATGVTKRTLYNHFTSKDALTGAVLDHQHVLALAQIKIWNETPVTDAADYVSTLFANLGKWASTPRWLGSGFTRLTMELADLPGHPARRAAHTHKAAVEDWLAVELERLEVEHPRVVARQLMVLIEGCLSLILIHGDTSYAGAAAEAAKRLVSSDSQ